MFFRTYMYTKSSLQRESEPNRFGNEMGGGQKLCLPCTTQQEIMCSSEHDKTPEILHENTLMIDCQYKLREHSTTYSTHRTHLHGR